MGLGSVHLWAVQRNKHRAQRKHAIGAHIYIYIYIDGRAETDLRSRYSLFSSIPDIEATDGYDNVGRYSALTPPNLGVSPGAVD